MNTLTIAGRLGRDADTRYSSAGKAICNFSVAVDQRRAGGEKGTLWVDCSIWGERAEKLAPYLTKGTVVSVSGEASARAWTPRGGGDPVGQLCLFVREVTLLGGGERSQGAGAERPKPAARPDRYAPTEAPTADDFGDDIPFVRSDSIY